MQKYILDNKFRIIRLLISCILSCFLFQCSTYKVDDSYLNGIEHKDSGILKFDFKELNDTPGNPHKDENYKVWLVVNDVVYYYLWEFGINDLMKVPIPTGKVKIQVELRNLSGLRWCKGVLNPYFLNVNPGEIFKIKIKSIDMDIRSREQMSVGAAGAGPAGFGCLFLMPREYYIHLDIEKIGAKVDTNNKKN